MKNPKRITTGAMQQRRTQPQSRPSAKAPITAWVSAPPKTGSTWISMMLSWALDWPTMALIPRPGRAEQELRVTREFELNLTNIFLPHTHTKASETTIEFIKTYDVKTVIPTRDILDTLVSVYDHLVNLGPRLPCGYVPSSFKTWAPANQKALIIKLLLPWYVSYYASWAYAKAEHNIQAHYVPYEAMLRDPKAELLSALKYIGVTRTDQQVERAVAESQQKPTRFNQGIAGRGLDFFNYSEIEQINDIMMCQKDVVITSLLNTVWNPSALEKKKEKDEATNDPKI